MIDHDDFDRLRRRVLWAMPTGLYVIGSRGTLDTVVQVNLMTASLVLQVATEPKLVAVAVDVSAFTHQLIEAGGSFSVCLLDRADRAVVRRFVKPTDQASVEFDEDGHPRSMAGEEVFVAETGVPILHRSPAWLDCRLHERTHAVSHSLFIGEVVDVGGPDGDLSEVLRMEDTRMSYGG